MWVLREHFPGFFLVEGREESLTRHSPLLLEGNSLTKAETMLRRSFLSALSLRPASRAASTAATLSIRYSTTGPATIVDRGFWQSLVPKPLRKENRRSLKAHYGKRWNPATFFIVIFLLIGSMSIQMIALRNSFDRYMRTSQVRIGLLREVVERIQNGETVDVEKLLGTGEPEKEADWEEGEFLDKSIVRSLSTDLMSQSCEPSKIAREPKSHRKRRLQSNQKPRNLSPQQLSARTKVSLDRIRHQRRGHPLQA